MVEKQLILWHLQLETKRYVCIHASAQFGFPRHSIQDPYLGNALILAGRCFRVSIAKIKHHDQEQLCKEKVHFPLQLLGPTLSWKKVRIGI